MFQPRIPGSIGLTKGRVDPVCSRFGLVKGSGVNPMNHETGPHALASIPFSFSFCNAKQVVSVSASLRSFPAGEQATG